MTRTTNLAALAGLSLMLGGCAATAVPRVTPPPTSSAPAPLNPPRVTQNNALVGRDANSALRLFGKPRLDVSEGAGRKLQFAGSACVLMFTITPSAQAPRRLPPMSTRAPPTGATRMSTAASPHCGGRAKVDPETSALGAIDRARIE